MSNHYTRKTKLHNSEILRNAKAILGQTADEVSKLLKEAHTMHKKPNTNQWLFWSLVRAAQYVGVCLDRDDSAVHKSDLEMVDAVSKYCGLYE